MIQQTDAEFILSLSRRLKNIYLISSCLFGDLETRGNITISISRRLDYSDRKKIYLQVFVPSDGSEGQDVFYSDKIERNPNEFTMCIENIGLKMRKVLELSPKTPDYFGQLSVLINDLSGFCLNK